MGPSKTTMYRVIEHSPMKRLLALGTVAVATVGALVLGFALGQNQTVSDRKAITALRAELQQSQAHIAELEAAVVDAELGVSVQTTAAHALRQNLTDMHDKNAVVIEELTFYKSLMAPSSLPQGLQISELVIESTAVENSFRFQLLLTQVAKRRSYISGEVSIDVIGHFVGAQDVEGVLSLTELAEAAIYPLRFKFRYFQDIAGLLEIPSSYTPQRVLVTATREGEQPLQSSFEWQVEPRRE